VTGGGVLAGRRIVVTRAEHQAQELSDALVALGAEPLLLPGLVIGPPSDPRAAEEALARLAQFDWLVFSSANAVEAFSRLARERLSPATRIAAVGPKTARALADHGLPVALVAEEAIAESLAEALAQHVSGRRVLVPRAETAREALPDALRRAGATEVCVVPVYRAVPAESEAYGMVATRLSRGEIDALTFASARTVDAVVEGLRAILGAATIELLGRARIFSIGPQTTHALQAHGMKSVHEADPHTLEGMIAEIVRSFGAA
jgi:uroporphyrinogen III methyltransferase/synthase